MNQGNEVCPSYPNGEHNGRIGSPIEGVVERQRETLEHSFRDGLGKPSSEAEYCRVT